jgi:glycerophosphoryl diester phosphodiesterase
MSRFYQARPGADGAKTAFFETPRPLVFAHRGGACLAPENTLAAMDCGLSWGADGIELDVRLSRDGIAVVHHDATLDRTTDESGEIAARTADELQRVDAAYRFEAGSAFPYRGQGIGIPLLTTVLARYRDTRVIVEMKVNSVDLARAVVGAVRAARAEDRVCLGSFGLRTLRAARVLAPEIATSAAREEVRWALYRSWCRWPVSRVAYGGYQVPENAGSTRVVSPRFIDAAHGAGLAVQVWTVDAPAAARRLLAWGVDALITDRPDLIVPIVDGGTRNATRPGPP